jgi:hypothetical protein
MIFVPDPHAIAAHRSWLSAFDPQYQRNWDKLLNADPEAAMCEADVRELFEENGNRVEPNEDLTGAHLSPDFRCTQGDSRFFVEVTCISIEKATGVTNLEHIPSSEDASCFSPLNDAIFSASKAKTRQCSGLGHPALLAVGTFHFQASCICFDQMHLEMLLTGKTMIAHNINTSTGTPIGDWYEATRLRSATFLRPDTTSRMSHARNPISGILLCRFGCNRPKVRGVLHPDPVHAFDRSLLSKIEFCRLRPGYRSGQLGTEWI